jgi:hypothetical protein
MDKYVGWLTPASAITDDMKTFEARLKKNYKDTETTVHFPNHQYLAGDRCSLIPPIWDTSFRSSKTQTSTRSIPSANTS